MLPRWRKKNQMREETITRALSEEMDGIRGLFKPTSDGHVQEYMNKSK